MGKTIIKNTRNNITINIGELISYRDLFLTLAFRDFKVRYTQTLFGFLWVLFQPIVTLFVFTLVFKKVINLDTGTIPYPLFAMAGLCSWNYFSFVVTQSGASLISSQAIISKIYFPRLILPISKAVVGFIDFILLLILLFILMLYYGFKPDINIIFLPLFILLTVMSALTAGIWISAITIRFRDFQQILPFIIQVGLFITPIAYPVHSAPEKYKVLFYLNPMTSIVQGFRWCLLGIEPPGMLNYISFFFVFILFISGLYYFKRTEKVMADIL